MKNILKFLIRLFNLVSIIISFIIFIPYVLLVVVIIVPAEFLLVSTIYYLLTGKWYYDDIMGEWFPVVYNLEDTWFEKFPWFTIDEDNLKK